MDALELAYTPHPASKRRVTPMAVVGSTHRADGTRGLAAAAVTSLAMFGAVALLASPRGSAADPVSPIANSAPAFEARAAAPVRPAAEPAPVENRSSSPLPFAGDSLGAEPVPPPAPAYAAAREQHVLTSFDGSRTMTDGPTIARADAARDAEQQRRAFTPAPVVWNHPVEWISVHKQGL
jgi:hypothetical protein